MGYAWIYNYKKDPELAEFQNILNCLETGIQTRLMTEETTKMPETDAEEQTEHMNNNKMT
eukprot:4563093-Heterocapsa_arctica.AAC.1